MAKLFFPLTGGRASWNSTINQSWEVEEVKSASGLRRTLCQQVFPNWVFNLTFEHISKQEHDELLAFYANTRGKHKAFYFKDFDHRVEGQRLAKNDDGTFQAVINYGGYVEPALYVENVKVYLNGTETMDFTVSDGRITIPNAGSAVVTADYDFWWYVSFTGDFSMTQLFNNVYNFTLKLEVVRE